MNEEIKVKFGGDTTALDRVMKGMANQGKKLGSDFAHSMNEGLKELAAPLSIGAMVATIHQAAEKAKEINFGSAQTGLDPEKFQRMAFAAHEIKGGAEAATAGLTKLNVQIGKAISGGDEAQKAFKKWGIELTGKDNAQVIDEIADKMKAMPDPALRAAMAVELMGKNGAALVPLLERGADAVREMGSHAEIFSKGDLENITAANESINQMSNRVLIWTGKLISGVATLAKEAGSLFGGGGGVIGMSGEQEKKSGEVHGKSEMSPEEIQHAKDYAKAIADVARAKQDLAGRGSGELGKLLRLQGERAQLEQDFKSAKDGTIEKLKIEAELLKKQAEIADQAGKVDKDAADKKLQTAQKLNDLKKRQAEIEAEIKRKEDDIGAFDLKKLAQFANLKQRGGRSLSDNEKNALDANKELGLLETAKRTGDHAGEALHQKNYLSLVKKNHALDSTTRDPAGRSEAHLDKIKSDIAKLSGMVKKDGLQVCTSEETP